MLERFCIFKDLFRAFLASLDNCVRYRCNRPRLYLTEEHSIVSGKSETFPFNLVRFQESVTSGKGTLDAILSQINKKIGERYHFLWHQRRLNYQFSNYLIDKVNGSRGPDPGDGENRAYASRRWQTLLLVIVWGERDESLTWWWQDSRRSANGNLAFLYTSFGARLSRGEMNSWRTNPKGRLWVIYFSWEKQVSVAPKDVPRRSIFLFPHPYPPALAVNKSPAVLITSAEREVRDLRGSGMSWSFLGGTRLSMQSLWVFGFIRPVDEVRAEPVQDI